MDEDTEGQESLVSYPNLPIAWKEQRPNWNPGSLGSQPDSFASALVK